MTWLDLYNHLHGEANDINNVGHFPWQETIRVFDFATLEYFPADMVKMPNGKLSFSVDTQTNGERD